ncbi:serine hydrolase [Bradyrhizobium sp. 190]|uniref:serine hydrolase n=1 Tax=Bradyrhizobium sp. 190 TaxID=2782658 RepID=UPI001FF7425D|nr:serine hydrolase [Bradyrhizobium sp. 190]MCK1512583.1 serine hydrolase [Bradyrhizobium sp. 190]
MLHRRSVLLAGPALLLARGRAQAQSMQAQAMPEQDLAAILRERVDIGRDTMGLVAATIDRGRRSVMAYGRSGTDRPLDADTVFEIGSITKVLTALLLADMVLRGEVAADDPAAKFLPASVKMPDFEGAPITLMDLATYTSGLPRMPSNFAPKDWANPYIDYTAGRLYDYLSNHKLGFKPGTHYEYANLGFGLLGHILELRAGRSYEELVVSRICAPLGMDDTRITLKSSMRQRLAQGHSAGLAPVSNWDYSAFAGAGAFRSTANDLLKFLQMCLDPTDTPVGAALKMTLSERRPRAEERDVALGWFVSLRFGDELIWKSGGTGGYATFIGYSTKTRRNCILLSNAADYDPNIALGMHLVNAAYPLPKLRREVQVDPTVLATYAGRYEISPKFILTVRPDGGRLFIQATAQPEYEAYAESETEFFYRVVDAQVSFARPEGGVSPSLTLHQNGKNLPGKRMP